MYKVWGELLEIRGHFLRMQVRGDGHKTNTLIPAEDIKTKLFPNTSG